LFKYLLQEVKHQYLLKEKLFSSEFNVANHAIGFVDEAVLSEKDEIAFELLNKGAKAFYAISYVLKRSDPNFELYTELKKKYEKFPYAFDSAGRGIIYSLLEFINSKKYKSQFEKEQIEDDIIFCVKNGAWYESEGQMNLRTYASDYNWQIAKAFEESSRNPFLETYEEYSGDTLESVHSYRNGLMDGTWYSYINKGEIRSKTVYDYGVLKYRHEREYENWKFTGKETITRTEEDNIVIKEVRMNDVLQLRETKNKQKGWFKKEEYYETGDLHKVTETENGFGSKVGYYKTGVKEAEGKVKNGAAVGLWYFFRENGDKLAEAVYSGDSLTWEETRFHENGTRSFKQIVVKGKKNGPFVAFDENGVKRTEGSYLNDQYHGAFNEYYPTGKLYYSGSYSEGKKSGSWVSYDENGKTIHRHLYGKESQGVEAREAPSKGRKSLTNTNQLLLIIFLVLLVLVIVLSIFK
jgi:antitoxin component YwqK of YwqJK toxin-antitoxin module